MNLEKSQDNQEKLSEQTQLDIAQDAAQKISTIDQKAKQAIQILPEKSAQISQKSAESQAAIAEIAEQAAKKSKENQHLTLEYIATLA